MNGFARPNVRPGSASRRNNDIRQDLIAQRTGHQAELERLGEELLALEDMRRQRIQSIKNLTQQIEALDEGAASGSAVIRNYFDEFEWSARMREQMRKVFGIENFRLAQEGYAIFVAWDPPARLLIKNIMMGFPLVGKTVCAMRTWTDEISFASCPLVSGDFSSPSQSRID